MLLSLLFATAVATATPAIPQDIATPVRDYIAANAAQQVAPLRRAFDPVASMYWVNAAGGVDARTMAEWRTRLAASAAHPRWTQRLVAIDRDGDAAVATVTGTRDDAAVTDLLLLMRVEGRWQAVGKVFTDAPLSAAPDPAGADAIAALVRAKFDSDRASDGALLLSTQDARATFFNLDDGRLVPASAQEWAARYDQRRREDAAKRPAAQRIEATTALGDIGYARWTTTTAGGRTIVDYALLLRTGAGWRFVNTAFVDAAPP